MFRRKFNVLAGAIGAVISLNCLGLGLGEIAVRSSLGDPLAAQIPMTDLETLTEEEIKVTLASKEDFDLVGIDMASELQKLSFAVDLSSLSEPLIRVYSQQPMENPYLSVLVDVQWPTGRLLREYSLHLEQPAFLEGGANPAASVIAPTSGSGANSSRRKMGLSAFQVDPQAGKNPRSVKDSAIPVAPIIRPSVRSAPQPSPADVAPGQGTQSNDEEPPGERAVDLESYTIQSGDTLWSIASRLPVSQSMDRRMAVIRDLNPDAFINSDMNLIREGADLLLPMDDSLFTLETNAGTAENSPQSQSGDTANSATAAFENSSGAPAVSPQESTTSTIPPPPAAHLTLSGSDPVESGDTLGGSRFKHSPVSRGEFESSQEGVEHSLRENEELKVLVNSLQEQLDTMHELMEVQNSELQRLQASLAKPSNPQQLSRETTNPSTWVIYAIGIGASLVAALGFLFFRRSSATSAREDRGFSI